MEDLEMMGTLEEETTPISEGTSETEEVENEAAQPQADENETEGSEGAVANNGEDIDFLEVKFNKQHKSLNKEEAVKYAQMGMNYERFEPLIAKLDYLAAVNGVTREQFIEGQLKSKEDAERQSLIERFGNDEETINAMMEFTKQKHQKAYDEMIARQKADEEAAEESTEARIAGEFATLCEEFPELAEKGFKGLPKQVKQDSFNGENLFNAYLRHLHRESKNIAADKKQEEAAANHSTGSMESQGESSSMGDAFLNGLLK